MSVKLPKNSHDLCVRNEEIKRHFGDDAFFLTSHFVALPESGALEIVIDETCPVLVNGRIKTKIDAPADMMTLNEGRSKMLANKGYIALAAGGFVWMGDDKIALLKRDSDAPLLANHWTNPSGMCGEHPFETADKEVSEEIALFDSTQSLLLRFKAANSPPPENDNAFNNLKKGGIECQTLKVDYISLDSTSCQRKVGGILVKVMIGGNTRQQKIPHIHLDSGNNLIALNQVFRFVNASGTITVLDGESFGRIGGFFTKNDALNLPLVPTTKDYLEQCISSP